MKCWRCGAAGRPRNERRVPDPEFLYQFASGQWICMACVVLLCGVAEAVWLKERLEGRP